MEKQLKCFLLLSLKEMALRRMSVLLWSDSDISTSFLKFPIYGYGSNEWGKKLRETTLDKVVDKVSKLDLPKSLTKQMIDIFHPIGVEIRRWKEIHQDIFSILLEDINLPVWVKLGWTTAGTIDDKKNSGSTHTLRCARCPETLRTSLRILFGRLHSTSLGRTPRRDEGSLSERKQFVLSVLLLASHS
ncbi:hypothetical protein AVEN_110084-1 [Araneus ventricosus]|uniref:Uncharacterized protein n=1 Tax=Araneus ventricosus TaxID=182803 RepID=A0A4Y2NGB2_ARAVE|nr:hypothetical protein AVEN_91380-1 [Araneus ventricosus]GBN37774.1 hypothetical protein AVEN_110084-1 [Araneus ventricosus]